MLAVWTRLLSHFLAFWRDKRLVFVLGAIYVQKFTGASQNPLGSSIASYAVTRAVYVTTDALREAHDPMANVTTWIYNTALGRLSSTLVDPDRGTENPHVRSEWQHGQEGGCARWRGGTTCMSYDGMNRLTGKQAWSGSACSASSYVCYTYTSTAGGNMGIGRKTGESFTGAFAGASQSGAYT